MAFPIKSHLPLITTHVEFQFSVLSLPPPVTMRRDLGARIRRQVHHKSPYGRPRHIRKETGAKSPSVVLDPTDLDSDLSDSESDSNDSEGCGNLNKIPKPSGEAGRTNSGGYNLERTLGWEEKRFATFTVSHAAINRDNYSYRHNRNLSMSKSPRHSTHHCATVNRNRLKLMSVSN